MEAAPAEPRPDMATLGQLSVSLKAEEVSIDTSKAKATVSLQPEDIVVTAFLGKGNYATVFKGRYKGKSVAIKAVPNLTGSKDGEFAIQSFVHEAVLMQGCHHENILEVYGTTLLEGSRFSRLRGYEPFVGNQAFAIIQELGSANTLQQKVGLQMQSPTTRVYTEADALQWMMDVARGIAHLHGAPKMIIHRDMKLENVLLVKRGDRQVAKLADFGLSVMVAKGSKAVSAGDVATMQRGVSVGSVVEDWARQNAAPDPDPVAEVDAAEVATGAFLSLFSNVQSRKSLARTVSSSSADLPPPPLITAVAPKAAPAPQAIEASEPPPKAPQSLVANTAPLAGYQWPSPGPTSSVPLDPSTVPLAAETSEAESGKPAGGAPMRDVWAMVREKHVSSAAEARKAAKARLNRKFSRLRSLMSGPRPTDVWAMTGQTGSYATMAPEVTRNERYNEKIDIFALGVMMWEVFGRTVLSGSFDYAWQLEAHAKKVAEEGYRPPMPDHFTPGLKDLVAQCWAQEARARPTASQVVAALESMQQSGELVGMFPRNGCLCF